jgi:hypothetical protein
MRASVPEAAPDRSGPARTREHLFLSQLPDIERIIGWVCAQRGLRGADAEDFGSVVKCRLIESDYEVLTKFEGRSSLRTYLTVVINRFYLDFQVQRAPIALAKSFQLASHMQPNILQIGGWLIRHAAYLEAAATQRPLIARRLPNIAPDLDRFGFRFGTGAAKCGPGAGNQSNKPVEAATGTDAGEF